MTLVYEMSGIENQAASASEGRLLYIYVLLTVSPLKMLQITRHIIFIAACQ